MNKVHSIKLLVSLLCCILFAACAKDYQGVAEGPKANFEFTVNKVSDGIFTTPTVTFYISECDPREYKGAFSLTADNPTTTKTIRAGRTVRIQVEYRQNVSGGKIEKGELFLIFEPKVDANYELDYIQKVDRFSVAVYEVDPVTGSKRDVEVKTTNAVMSTEYCKK